jgi:SAM-dependent methyltransferase
MFTKEQLLKKEGEMKNSTMEEDMEYVQADAAILPFKDNYADLIESSDMIEHIPFRQVPFVLKEMFRVLKKGGELKIQTTNFDELAKLWAEQVIDKNMDFSDVNCPFFNLQEIIYGNQNHGGEFHISLFNPAYMKALLAYIGFSDIIITIYPTGGSCIVDMETKEELNKEIIASGDTWKTRTEMMVAHAKK